MKLIYKAVRRFLSSSLCLLIGINLAFTSFTIAADPEGKLPALKDINIILIIIDTMAARYLGTYDVQNNFTPQIDKLAAKSLVFERAYSAAPWTKPAISSIFTGKLPHNHGVTALNSKLGDSNQTLAEMLKAKGFSTVGFISHTLITRRFGFNQGFDKYELVPFKGNVHDAVTSEEVSQAATQWLEQNKKQFDKQRFFLFLHYFDPHYNYQHHQKFDRTSWYKGSIEPGLGIRLLRDRIGKLEPDDIRYLKNLYQEEIAYTDAAIGNVLEALSKQNLDKNTLVILTADHGEEFMEHGWIGHTRTLYDELIHVPLIVKVPQLSASRVRNVVSTLDIVPSLLALDSEKHSSNFDGQKFWPGDNNLNRDSSKRSVFAEVDFKSSAIKARKRAIIEDRWKYIEDHLENSSKLIDLLSDSKEMTNVAAQHNELVASLKEKLSAALRRSSKQAIKGDNVEQLPEEVEQLKSLGYL